MFSRYFGQNLDRPFRTVPKVWGREEWFFNSEAYCMKKLVVNQRGRVSEHYHKNKHETFTLLNGLLYMDLSGNAGEGHMIMRPGHTLPLIPGTKHSFTGLTDCVIIESSSYHEDEDSYRTPGKESRVLDVEEFRDFLISLRYVSELSPEELSLLEI